MVAWWSEGPGFTATRLLPQGGTTTYYKGDYKERGSSCDCE
jgi:hypothetical protein